MLAVAHVLGLMLAFFATTFLLPMACSVLTQDGMFIDFAVAAALNVIGGLGLAGATRRYKRELKPRDGFLLVTLSWTLMSASASIPLLIALPELSFTDAYFEAVSGLTTTGSTVLTGLDRLPPSINFWRHVLHWFGGIGIIVLAVAVLPLLGVGGMQLYRAEAPGAVKDQKLTPRITETAKALWFTYAGITVLAIVVLKMLGMSWFDAICHAFSVVSLGGFSTHDRSIGWFDSLGIELALALFMLVSSLSFARHFVAFRRLSLKPYKGDSEAKAIVAILLVSIVLITWLLIGSRTYADFGTSLRHATFTVISIATTSGFVTENYELWPIFAPLWLLFLSGIVCATGSTGGGIKMFRTLLLAKQALREMKLLVHPSAIVPVRIGGNVVPDRVAQSVLAFIFLYFQTIAILTFAMLLTGMDFVTALSSVVASVNNMGPALGPTGAAGTYKVITDVQTWICSAAMLLGRLEIFSVLVLFTPAFWRK